jgi:2-dehydro-3-deoxyglucarate aldolase/4-hydroxy-2-oxoheptanedioate aldolase
MGDIKGFREKIQRRETLIGTHVSLSDSSVTEIFGKLGFDYIWIDTEHTALDKQNVRQHLIAAKASGSLGFVRIPWNDPVLVKPILDIGADGVIFPFVCSREEAQKAIDSCYYPPRGIRGYGPNRAANYGLTEQQKYCNDAGDALFKIIQIEHIDAIKNLENILSVEGIDAVVVGPQDLSASMGILRQMGNKLLRSQCDRIVEACKKNDISVGVSCGFDAEFIEYWISQEIDLISVGMDYEFVLKGAMNVKQAIESLVK